MKKVNMLDPMYQRKEELNRDGISDMLIAYLHQVKKDKEAEDSKSTSHSI